MTSGESETTTPLNAPVASTELFDPLFIQLMNLFTREISFSLNRTWVAPPPLYDSAAHWPNG